MLGSLSATVASMSRALNASVERRWSSTFSCDIALAVSRRAGRALFGPSAVGPGAPVWGENFLRRVRPPQRGRRSWRRPGMVLLRQPHGFEGLPLVSEEAHPNDLAVPK